MTWEALSVYAQIGSTIAVFITLVYIALQVRIINQQRELNAFRHTYDSMNVFCDKMSQSKEIASIICRGRDSLEQLDRSEKIIFQHIHLRLLNTIESWYMQALKTSTKNDERDKQIQNISGLVSYYFSYSGSQAVWDNVKSTFEPIQDIVEQNIPKA